MCTNKWTLAKGKHARFRHSCSATQHGCSMTRTQLMYMKGLDHVPVHEWLLKKLLNFSTFLCAKTQCLMKIYVLHRQGKIKRWLDVV
jgi:hypothetical protein